MHQSLMGQGERGPRIPFRRAGYHVIGVNPGLAGKCVHGGRIGATQSEASSDGLLTRILKRLRIHDRHSQNDHGKGLMQKPSPERDH
jgi:hypothetical protein